MLRAVLFLVALTAGPSRRPCVEQTSARVPAAEASAEAPAAKAPAEALTIHGMTISCQTWGWEWGSDGFEGELDELAALGVNWIAIHPYARIRADGEVSWRAFDPESPPEWLARPIAAAHARGMSLLVKPHLAYWGSPFAWRGDIAFADPEAKARFWRGYGEWIEAVAKATRGADAFAVGTELDRLLEDEDEHEWRAIIARVRAAGATRLTYAANWTDFERVPFWDALDAVGVQAYFPLVDTKRGADSEPTDDELRAGWAPVLARLRTLHERSGKPIVFTELGYDAGPDAAREPWRDGPRSREERARWQGLQGRCLRIALEELDAQSEWLRGAFLWKWFVGDAHRGDASFWVDRADLRVLLHTAWSAARPPVAETRPTPAR